MFNGLGHLQILQQRINARDQIDHKFINLPPRDHILLIDISIIVMMKSLIIYISQDIPLEAEILTSSNLIMH